MGNKTDEEIRRERDVATKYLQDNDYEVLDTYFDYEDDEILSHDGIKNIPVFYLGKSIEALSRADVLYVCDGWMNARGCGIEVAVAKSYNIPIIYQSRPPYL